MQSPNVAHRPSVRSRAHAPRSRPLLALAAFVSMALGASAVACADDPARGGLAARPSRTLEDAGETGVGEAVPRDVPLVDIEGRVVDDLEQPIAGRTMVLVDRRGKRSQAVTDEDGAFFVPGVAAPYDVLVTPAPAGAVITPLVYLGVYRADPRLEVFERQGPTVRPASQPLRVGVKLPPCPAASGACWVSVVSASSTGGGATAGSFTEGAMSAVYEIDHAFTASSPRAGETIDVHVLVGNAEYTQYAYAQVLRVPARPGVPTELGMTAPQPVESSDPVSIAGRARSQPEGWEWTLASHLELPGGATFALRYAWAPATAMRLPLLPGATWHVGAWVQHPVVEERPYFHRSAQAWSGSLPLTTTNVSFELPLAPETVRPALEGTLSRSGAGLAWRESVSGVASIVLVDLRRAQQRFRAFTSEGEVPMVRLEALGLGPFEQGDHVLDLTTTPGTTVDELTQPDVRQRRRRFDIRVPGATTYQRFLFQITP